MSDLPAAIRALVPRETVVRLDAFVELLTHANETQNLISRSTIATLWDRHIVDSLQLLPLAAPGQWLDIGSGAGLPGLVIAIARRDAMTLVEPRAKRAAFLEETATALALGHVAVVRSKVESMAPLRASVISARAVSSLPALLAAGERHAAPDCVWLLHKGRGAQRELAAARETWQGDFRLIPSLTDPESSIVMARDVRPIAHSRGRGRR